MELEKNNYINLFLGAFGVEGTGRNSRFNSHVTHLVKTVSALELI